MNAYGPRFARLVALAVHGERLRGGFTLVELMVTLAISSILLIGATTIYIEGRSSFRLTETISRLQEDSRYILDALEPDIRMAGYFGLRSRPSQIEGRATPSESVPPGLAVGGDCTTNWSIDLERVVDGTNNQYDWPGCAPFGPGAQPNTDTLVIRRVSEDPDLVPSARSLYVQAARFRTSQLFLGPSIPPGFASDTTASHRLITHGYYVSQASDADPTRPSLRRKALVAGPAVTEPDEEILPGVEDFQVQFGVDLDPVGSPNRGSISRYVDPGDPIVDPDSALYEPEAQILAVRIWLRLRADRRENGYVDDATYIYAGQQAGPFNDAFRRIVVSKTIFLRNARTTT